MEIQTARVSTQHRYPLASDRIQTVLALEKPSAQNRPENYRPSHYYFDSGNEQRQSALGCSQDSRRVA
jgi:hypothetical protein